MRRRILPLLLTLLSINLASCAFAPQEPNFAGNGFSTDAVAPEGPYFKDVAGEAGIAGRPSPRVVFADLNGDGWQDCILDRQRAFLNVRGGGSGARSFVDFSRESGLVQRRVGNLMLFGDVDNDGDLDCYSAVYCDLENFDKDNRPKRDLGLRSELLLNDGKGRFSIAGNTGLMKYPSTECAAVFLDYDADGMLDLFTGSWYRTYGKGLECYPCRLYKGDGAGFFSDANESALIINEPEHGKRTSARPVYGAGHTDYNNDGFQDILVCVYGRQWNFLWRNNGDGTFADTGDSTNFDGDADETGLYPEWIQDFFIERYGEPRADEDPFRSNGNTFSVAAGDYDNDGDIDLVLGEITHGWAGPSSDRSSLLTNSGKEGGFAFERDPGSLSREHADEQKWNQGDMHVAMFDYDNDCDLDILVSSGDYPDGQYLRLFEQQSDHKFVDATEKAGFNWMNSNGISIADYDRDGDLDVLAGNSNMRLPAEMREGRKVEAALFRNDVGNRNNWVEFRLRGAGEGASNASAIGARVYVRCGDLVQMREVYGGSGHSGQQNSLDLHFGLGRFEKIDEVAVIWPDGRNVRVNITGVKPNGFYTVREGIGEAALFNLD